MKDVMTKIEAAEYLRLHPVSIQRYLTQGKIKGELRRVIGKGKWFITREQVGDFLKAKHD